MRLRLHPTFGANSRSSRRVKTLLKGYDIRSDFSCYGSDNRSAINQEFLSRDVARLVLQKEHHSLRHIGGAADTPKRRAGTELVLGFFESLVGSLGLLGELAPQSRPFHTSRAVAVNANTTLSGLKSRRSGQPVQRPFCSGVERIQTHTLETVCAAEMDDASELLLNQVWTDTPHRQDNSQYH